MLAFMCVAPSPMLSSCLAGICVPPRISLSLLCLGMHALLMYVFPSFAWICMLLPYLTLCLTWICPIHYLFPSITSWDNEWSTHT